MTQTLADNNIDMKALSLAETKDFGIARLIVDDVYETMTALKDAGYICRLTPVVVVEIPDEPGGLNKILRYFTAAGVNVEYMYAFMDSSVDNAYMIFRVEDAEEAEACLAGKGIRVASQDDLSGL
jgi:hypothetical protein